MVGRALDRKVECHLDTRLRGRGDHRVEIGFRAEVGMQRIVAPSTAPIAHGLPGSRAPAFSELLRPLRWVRPIGCTGGR